MVTPRWVAFNNDSMAVMCTHWVFTLTQWRSCTLTACSGAVPTHSLAFMSTQWSSGAVPAHSLAFTCTHKHTGGVQYSLKGVQPVHILKGPLDMFSNMQSTLKTYKFALNFHWMPFLWLCQTRRLDVTLEYMIGRWSCCLPMRLATKNKKVLQKIRKLDISQVLFN
jgi:hypothetical protein